MLDGEFANTSKYTTIISTLYLYCKYRQSSDADSVELAYQGFWWLVFNGRHNSINSGNLTFLQFTVSCHGLTLSDN